MIDDKLKASMFDSIVKTYLDKDDGDEMVECILSKLDIYIDLMTTLVEKGD